MTDGLSTCFTREREISPAVQAAFTHFWADTDGIQTELVRTWARLARAFAGIRNVAGYDLLNEPNPGYTVGVSQAVLTARFYARATSAIRTAERRTRGGFRHIVFFEPGVLWSATGTDVPPAPALITDPDVVFAPHLYSGSISPTSVPQGYRLAQQAAEQYGATVWSGEWGFYGTPAAQDAGNLQEWAAQEDAHRWSDAWWDWRQACGDPHQFGDADATAPLPVSPSLHRYACPSGRDLGIPTTERRVLSRPYVRLSPGRLSALRVDPAARTLTAAGVDPSRRGSCRLQAWVPGAARPRVSGRSLSGVAVRRYPGGWFVSGCAGRAWSLHVTTPPRK